MQGRRQCGWTPNGCTAQHNILCRQTSQSPDIAELNLFHFFWIDFSQSNSLTLWGPVVGTVKYYMSVWCMSWKSLLFLLRPQAGEVWSDTALAGEESSRSAEKPPWKQAYRKCWRRNLACSYLFMSRYLLHQVHGNRKHNSPGDSSSHAAGVKAEMPVCCPAEVCFHREW